MTKKMVPMVGLTEGWDTGGGGCAFTLRGCKFLKWEKLFSIHSKFWSFCCLAESR